ncbi:cucumber peeling cupredoxin-like [Macadamia integrifolia]|uniref:cucumber peeling cupredoxin-like n=1 Tax=Macadamia integrifolia TaxID=60698 RepID=UPI001C4FC71C|nr:cucumber peeling cupredoxin-like [Macadamia integrifolia]XP_042503268.1 cucumber peeling cupredoxin-like [Macadamia integrifolia]
MASLSSFMGWLLGCMFIIAALLQGADAETTHTVGGSIGWTIPPSNFSYETWAASQTFMVGDYLFFNFTSNTTNDDVAEVYSKADYESCNKTSVSITLGSSLSTLITTAGEHYYFSTIGQNCVKNQKLAINASGTPISSPSPPSSASLTVGGFTLLLLSTIIPFFY